VAYPCAIGTRPPEDGAVEDVKRWWRRNVRRQPKRVLAACRNVHAFSRISEDVARRLHDRSRVNATVSIIGYVTHEVPSRSGYKPAADGAHGVEPRVGVAEQILRAWLGAIAWLGGAAAGPHRYWTCTPSRRCRSWPSHERDHQLEPPRPCREGAPIDKIQEPKTGSGVRALATYLDAEDVGFRPHVPDDRQMFPGMPCRILWPASSSAERQAGMARLAWAGFRP
jgi:hypothetical protein